jgi:hypothetical protein
MCFPRYRYSPEELSALPLNTATQLNYCASPKNQVLEINSPSLLNSSRSVQHSTLTCYNILCHSINKSCTLITTVHHTAQHTDPRHTDYTFTKGWSPLSLRTDRDTHEYTEPKRDLHAHTCPSATYRVSAHHVLSLLQVHSRGALCSASQHSH